MTENNQNTENKNLNVAEVVSKTESFLEKNQKIILIVIGAIILLVAGYFAYVKLYAEPRENTASSELFGAEHYFNNEDMDKALNGDGKHLGLVAFINKYGGTKSGNLARYYAGCAYITKGEHQKAIDYLSDFKAKDAFIGTQAKSLIGDCYMELNKVDEAISYYTKASETNPNEMTTPFTLMKLGMAYEIKKDNKKALDCYKRIKEEFPNSAEFREIEKYISRLENL